MLKSYPAGNIEQKEAVRRKRHFEIQLQKIVSIGGVTNYCSMYGFYFVTESNIHICGHKRVVTLILLRPD